MAIVIGVPKEQAAGEHRVAVVPEIVKKFKIAGFDVVVEAGAGSDAHFTDAAYTSAGATIVSTTPALYEQANIIVKVQPPGVTELDALSDGKFLIGFMSPYRYVTHVARIASKHVTSFAIELVPRTTRAQAMDVLSSQATVVGYSAVIHGASLSNRFFPMLTTAAGTIRPSRVLVLGAGVAGLQAIATARRLGAIVEAYDVRRAVKEEVESLGAKFIGITLDAEVSGGYARELTELEQQQERELVDQHLAQADVIITTAQIPGRMAPKLITEQMIKHMKPGAVIIDCAADSGGNTTCTKPGEAVTRDDVLIYGPMNLPSDLPVHASEMYAKNIYNFVMLLTHDGESLEPDWNDDIIAGTLLTHNGKIAHEPTRQLAERATS
jgi:H+-translocating NAD(P) transhydrogenase subunit alpha